jgi:DNA-binding transcriptional MerR regulator
MLSIGRFADASGLTVTALRHYDEIGLLVPAHVDPETGHRYYDTGQIEQAVAIRRLRALELPLERIRALLDADADTFRAGLAAHGYRVSAEAHDKHMLLIELAALVEGGEVPVELQLVDEPELRLAATIRQLHQDDVGTAIQEMARGVREHLRGRGIEPSGPATALF